MLDFAGQNGRPSPATRFFLFLGYDKLVLDRLLDHLELVLAGFLWICRVHWEKQLDSTASFEDAYGGEVDILAIDARPAFHQKLWDLWRIVQRAWKAGTDGATVSAYLYDPDSACGGVGKHVFVWLRLGLVAILSELNIEGLVLTLFGLHRR